MRVLITLPLSAAVTANIDGHAQFELLFLLRFMGRQNSGVILLWNSFGGAAWMNLR